MTNLNVVVKRTKKPTSESYEKARAETEALEKEVEHMEAKIKAMKLQQKDEKEHWSTVKRTKDGSLWKRGRAQINYTNTVMDEVTTKNLKRSSRLALAPPVKSKGSRSKKTIQMDQPPQSSTFLTALDENTPKMASKPTTPVPPKSKKKRGILGRKN